MLGLRIKDYLDLLPNFHLVTGPCSFPLDCLLWGLRKGLRFGAWRSSVGPIAQRRPGLLLCGFSTLMGAGEFIAEIWTLHKLAIGT